MGAHCLSNEEHSREVTTLKAKMTACEKAHFQLNEKHEKQVANFLNQIASLGSENESTKKSYQLRIEDLQRDFEAVKNEQTVKIQQYEDMTSKLQRLINQREEQLERRQLHIQALKKQKVFCESKLVRMQAEISALREDQSKTQRSHLETVNLDNRTQASLDRVTDEFRKLQSQYEELLQKSHIGGMAHESPRGSSASSGAVGGCGSVNMAESQLRKLEKKNRELMLLNANETTRRNEITHLFKKVSEESKKREHEIVSLKLQIKREQRRLRKHYQEKYAKAVKHMQENSGLRAN